MKKRLDDLEAKIEGRPAKGTAEAPIEIEDSDEEEVVDVTEEGEGETGVVEGRVEGSETEEGPVREEEGEERVPVPEAREEGDVESEGPRD